MDIQKQVRTFLVDNFFFGDEGVIDVSTSMRATGAIDSTGVMELITFLEETFSIAVADEEVIPENLDSIELITQYVERKLNDVSNRISGAA